MPAKGTSTVGTLRYFLDRMRHAANGCLEWTGTLSENGYGKAVVAYAGHGKPIRRYAHRALYEMRHGPVPDGMDLDHKCRNRRCVNDEHLEPVSRAENVRRGDLPRLMRDTAFRPGRRLVAVCKSGHSMTGENVGQSGGRRTCRACKRDTSRRIRSRTVKIINTMAAQGDVVFRKVDAIPKGFAGQPNNGRIIVAHSETQHHHAIDDTGVVHYTGGDPLISYLRLESVGSCDVVHHRPHDTHETLRLGGGVGSVYQVIRQREYTPEGWRRVED